MKRARSVTNIDDTDDDEPQLLKGQLLRDCDWMQVVFGYCDATSAGKLRQVCHRFRAIFDFAVYAHELSPTIPLILRGSMTNIAEHSFVPVSPVVLDWYIMFVWASTWQRHQQCYLLLVLSIDGKKQGPFPVSRLAGAPMWRLKKTREFKPEFMAQDRDETKEGRNIYTMEKDISPGYRHVAKLELAQGVSPRIEAASIDAFADWNREWIGNVGWKAYTRWWVAPVVPQGPRKYGCVRIRQPRKHRFIVDLTFGKKTLDVWEL